MTTRKAQGSSVDYAVLYFDLFKPAPRGFAYVGASRVRTSAGLFYFGKIRRSDWLPVGGDPMNEQVDRGADSSDSSESGRAPSIDESSEDECGLSMGEDSGMDSMADSVASMADMRDLLDVEDSASELNDLLDVEQEAMVDAHVPQPVSPSMFPGAFCNGRFIERPLSPRSLPRDTRGFRSASEVSATYPNPNDYVIDIVPKGRPTLSRYQLGPPKVPCFPYIGGGKLFYINACIWLFIDNDYTKAKCILCNRCSTTAHWKELERLFKWHQTFEEIKQLESERELYIETRERDDELADNRSLCGTRSAFSLESWMVPSS